MDYGGSIPLSNFRHISDSALLRCRNCWVMGNLPRTTFRDIDPVKSPLRQLDEERPSRQHTAGYPILKSIADAHTLASSATPVKGAPAVPSGTSRTAPPKRS